MAWIKRSQHWIISLLFLIALLMISLKFGRFKKGQWEADIRNQIQELLVSKKSSLEKALYSRIYYTRGVAAFVSLKPDISNDEFETLAKEFIKDDSIISTMSLSRDGIINAIYPLEGHEAAIGLNLLTHPERKEIVERTIFTHETFLAGPVELVEGGIAFISYTPIFNATSQPSGRFWGLTDIVIKRDELFQEANISLIYRNLEFALRGEDGKGVNGEVFWGDANIFNREPVTVSIDLPNGEWILAAVPEAGWAFYDDQDIVLNTVLIVSSIIISILLLIILKSVDRIRKNARELRAIFHSMDSLIFELNEEGEYLKIAPTNLDLLVRAPNEMIGHKINDIFAPDLAKLFMDAIHKCLKTKEVVVIDYPLEIKGKEVWFVARISYKTEKTVIYNAIDVTKIKVAENNLKKSEEHLARLNDVKDRFFSIVAHDLRNPIGSFSSITDLLLDKSIETTPEENERLIKSLNTTADGLSDLLENLLSWAMAQQGKLEIVASSQSINHLCERVKLGQLTHAMVKKIKIINKADADHYAIYDESATSLILRNLISNAIKFSNPNSEIILSSELSIIDGTEFLLVHVTDSGTGMPDEIVKNIFSSDNEYKKHGTKNEKGSGLGLVLCREFAEMQGGKIWATSELGKGSTFTIALPV